MHNGLCPAEDENKVVDHPQTHSHNIVLHFCQHIFLWCFGYAFLVLQGTRQRLSRSPSHKFRQQQLKLIAGANTNIARSVKSNTSGVAENNKIK